MTDGERDLTGLSADEETVARQLTELGPLMGELKRAEVELDAVFARTLRAHLVQGEERAPHPTFARNLRTRLLRDHLGHPRRKEPGRRAVAGARVAVATVIVITAALLAAMLHQQTPAVTFRVPYPTRADLVFSYPAPSVVIHRLRPTLSLIHPASGVPFAGHLQLNAGTLRIGPSTLRAYRLAPPFDVVPAGRRLLGIHSPVRRVVSRNEVWAVAAEGGGLSHQPIHSLAVSLRTGQLIYHDRRNSMLPHATHPLARSAAVASARRWLTRLGWPGQRMPLQFVATVASMPKVRDVAFGWIGVGQTATHAATLWVTPNGSVIEAWVWPPVVDSGGVPTRSLPAAWMDVRAGALPFAVEGISPSVKSTGTGMLQATSVVSVLSTHPRGGLYLVPTYRFQGTAHIPGASTHRWYSLAPSAQR